MSNGSRLFATIFHSGDEAILPEALAFAFGCCEKSDKGGGSVVAFNLHRKRFSISAFGESNVNRMRDCMRDFVG